MPFGLMQRMHMPAIEIVYPEHTASAPYNRRINPSGSRSVENIEKPVLVKPQADFQAQRTRFQDFRTCAGKTIPHRGK
jgi:hypothetical protein